MAKKTVYTYKFEVGYLKKSPCKECDKRKNFPKCIDDCPALDKIQTILSGVRSCTKSI
ncbi:MAG: hypothetical protein JRG74_09995 [Deltaproteobacteria bacterium]|nr:hypothetical protein [Deltaproteobacteria bacterium]